MSTTRLLSPFHIFILLIFCAGVAVLYVNNVVKVRQLLNDVKTLEYSRDSLLSSTNILRNEVLRLESSERISSIARDHLGLVQPPSAPIAIPRVRK